MDYILFKHATEITAILCNMVEDDSQQLYKENITFMSNVI